MQTGAFTDRERAIWKRLPLHPQPQPFETLTSYLTRLSSANGLQSMNELGVLAGATWSRVKTHPDYPCPVYEGLAGIAGCPAERLASTTLLHLAQHFGYSPHPKPLRRFLHTSLAPFLRYCPLCLAESSFPYYSLLWRFLTIPGCASHGCLLLEQCGQCGSPLPLVLRTPRLGCCPTCQRELSTCQTAALPRELMQVTQRRTEELEMLLSPRSRTVVDARPKVIGRRFAELRHLRNLSITAVASLMHMDERVVLDIEYVNQHRAATFSDYLQYADSLGYSLREVFASEHLQKHLTPLGEQQMVAQVEAAAQHLQARGIPVTQRSLVNCLGLPRTALHAYPSLLSSLKRDMQERRHEKAR